MAHDTEQKLGDVQDKMLDDLLVNGILQELEIRGKKTRFRNAQDVKIINDLLNQESGRYLPARSYARRTR